MSDLEAHERIYTFFHDDGPITMTEHELCNGYMGLLAENDGLREQFDALLQAARAVANTPIGDDRLLDKPGEWPQVPVLRSNLRRLRSALDSNPASEHPS